MDELIITLFCLIDDLLRAMNHQDDPQRHMSDAEVTTTAPVAAFCFGGNWTHAFRWLDAPHYIPYIRLRYEFVYLAVIMDVFTRSISGWHLGRGLDQSLTPIALDRALAQHTPEIHHSDQGIQYAATAYIQMLRAVDAEICMAESCEAWQNGYAERLIRIIKEEEVDLSQYDDYTHAVSQLGRFLNDVYMHKRIHSSLSYLTPIEFEERWRRNQGGPSDVH